MTAITDLSDLVNLLTGGGSGAPEHLFAIFDSRIAGAAAATPIAGRWTSLWKYNRSLNPVSANPGAAAIPTRATTGALQHTNAAGGKQKWLLGLEGVVTGSGTLMLYDRLFHMSGLSGTSLAAQTVQGDPASPALTRYNGASDCIGNQIFLEINTAIGATSTTITVTYFDEGNVLSTAPLVSIGNTGLREGERLLPVPLASGDKGVRGVKDVTLTGTTGTVGDFGVVIARPLGLLPMVANWGGLRDYLSGFPSSMEVLNDACLAMAFLCHTTSALNGFVGLHMVEK